MIERDNTIDRLDEVEARLIEQEHRIIPILKNFTNRKRYDVGSLKRKATIKALLWKLFSPASIAVTSGTIIAGLTLMILTWQGKEIKRQSDLAADQNSLIKAQNDYFQSQNRKLQNQIDNNKNRYKRTRTTELLSILYSVDETGKPKTNSKLREVSFIEFIGLDSQNLQNLSNVDLSNSILKELNISGGNLEFSKFTNAKLSNLDFQDTNLNKANFENAVLKNINFSNSNLEYANFDNCKIDGANFSNSKTWGISFVNAELSNSNLLIENSPRIDNLALGLENVKFIHNCQIDDTVAKYLQRKKPKIFNRPRPIPGRVGFGVPED